MKVSKHRWQGAKIDDLNELVSLAEDREAVAIRMGNTWCVRPAAFVLMWPLSQILRYEIFNALDYDPETVSHG